MSSKADVGDLENSLPSWISDDLGEKSYMADEVTQLTSSSIEDPPNPEVRPSVEALLPIERETNIMTMGELEVMLLPRGDPDQAPRSR